MSPIYTYICENCGGEEEHVVSFKDRDTIELECQQCHHKLKPRGIEIPTLGKSKYQMKAILSGGQKVKGHFGKAAALNKRKKKGG